MIRKLAYSAGGLAIALSSQAFSTYIIFFYVDGAKLPVYLAGMAMLIYSVWNAINDPIAGLISDSTHSRWGRRLPYLVASALPFGLVFFLLWVPPFSGLDQPFLLFLYFVVLVCLFDGLNAVIGVNWAALFPEMFHSLKERVEINSYRQAFGLTGILFGLALPPLFFGSVGWGWMGAIFGLAIFLILVVAIAGSRERKEFSREHSLSLIQELKATFKNRSFLTFVLANLFVQYAVTTSLAVMPFFAKYVLGANPQTVALILAAAFLPAIPMLFFWRIIAGRLGAKPVFLTAQILLALFLLPLFYIKSLGFILLDAALISAAMAGYLLTTDVLIADIIDE
ncbi:MAG: MFS transporter, partial [Candidatus Margulisbacteria bacterium]|nr:MFS transporter [Candidatus Margulisiibacteriota bacterium]